MASPGENQVILTLHGVEQALARVFRDKLPAFPPHIKAVVTRIAPWVFIISGGLGLLFWLAMLGVMAMAGALATGLGVFLPVVPSILGPLAVYLLLPVELILSVVGGFLMLGRKPIGWDLVFLGELMSAAMALLSFSVTGVLMSGLIVWALFNIRENFGPAPVSVPVAALPPV